MPVMDGIEATRLICAGELDMPRILILTTFDLDECSASSGCATRAQAVVVLYESGLVVPGA